MLNLPWEIYKDDRSWVPPLKLTVKEILDEKKHPFYKTSEVQSWLAVEGDRVLGRIMAIYNHAYNKFQDTNVGFFGFFECHNNQAVAFELFNEAEKWLRKKGAKKILGPVNPSTNYETGLLIKGFEDPAQLMMTYNPKFYESLFEQYGFKKAKDLIAYRLDTDFQMPEKIVRISERAEKRHGISYRKINLKDWNNEINRMHDIYNSAWEKNWGFVPMSDEEFFHTAKDLKSIVDPNLIIFVEVKGETAGFIVALPDFNQVFKNIPSGKLLPFGIFKLLRSKNYINRCRVITLGVKEQYRNLGLGPILYNRAHQKIIEAGYSEIEMSWILEDNLPMNKPLQLMGADPYKTYRVFEKEL